jgi:hypothetical protein
VSMHAMAGAGESDDDHDDSGLVVFGFVKDARGAPVANAKVTARVQGGVTFSLTTGAAGSYRFPLFRKDLNPADIVIACSKEGYKQTRVTRRPAAAKADAPKPIETECRLERG